MDFIRQLLEIPNLTEYVGHVVRAITYFSLAWIISHIARRTIRGLAFTQRLRRNRRTPLREERIDTIQRMLASVTTFVLFALATLLSLLPAIGADNLVWMASLFAAAFGLGLMPLVKDFFTGFTFLFEDPFDVGEKVELLVPSSVIGMVENVNLRTTLLRAETGEIYTIPNGEIRVSRNFSRGLHSQADVRIQVSAENLTQTLEMLEAWSDTAMLRLPNLVEPWRIINETGHIGQTVELKIVAKARFGKAAVLRPRLLAFVQERLARQGIELVD